MFLVHKYSTVFYWRIQILILIETEALESRSGSVISTDPDPDLGDLGEFEVLIFWQISRIGFVHKIYKTLHTLPALPLPFQNGREGWYPGGVQGFVDIVENPILPQSRYLLYEYLRILTCVSWNMFPLALATAAILAITGRLWITNETCNNNVNMIR